MAKIFIEEYKGQTINYEDNTDKFTCDISIEDNFATKNRMSLNDVRKEVDLFIKANLNFKPFKAIAVSGYNDGDFDVVEVNAIRTDGKLIVTEGNYKSHYGKEQAENLRKFDFDILKEKEIIEKEFQEAGKKIEMQRKALKDRLEKLDLSNYELK